MSFCWASRIRDKVYVTAVSTYMYYKLSFYVPGLKQEALEQKVFYCTH